MSRPPLNSIVRHTRNVGRSDLKKDIFLCHAGSDKADYVKPFAFALSKAGISFWLDEAEIEWGDRITDKINSGLSKSRLVVVFLSKSFLERKWPQAELGSVLNIETSTGEIRVLLLLLAPQEEIFRVYPLLADKLYKRWEEGLPTLIQSLQRRLGVEYKTDWSYCHPASYSGKVWIQLLPLPATKDQAHRYSVRWGPWQKEGELTFQGNESICLWHMKRNDGESDPIFFSVSPASRVVFGQGSPPIDECRDINFGWIRVENA